MQALEDFRKNISKIVPTKDVFKEKFLVDSHVIKYFVQDNNVVLSTVIKTLGEQVDSLEYITKMMKASCLGRGLNGGWISISENKKNVLLYKCYDNDGLSAANIENEIGNFLYLAINANSIRKLI